MLAVLSAVLWWAEPESEMGDTVRISLNKLAFLPDRVDLAAFGSGVGDSSSLARPSPARHGDGAKKGAGDGWSSSASLHLCRRLKEWIGVPEAGSWSAGEGSACLRCGRPDPEDEELGATRRLMRLHWPDPSRRRWCLLQLINAMRLGVLLFLLFGVVGVRSFLGCEVDVDLLVLDRFLFWSFTCTVLLL